MMHDQYNYILSSTVTYVYTYATFFNSFIPHTYIHMCTCMLNE